MRKAIEQGCRRCLCLAALAGLAGEALFRLCSSTCNCKKMLILNSEVCLSPSFHLDFLYIRIGRVSGLNYLSGISRLCFCLRCTGSFLLLLLSKTIIQQIPADNTYVPGSSRRL